MAVKTVLEHACLALPDVQRRYRRVWLWCPSLGFILNLLLEQGFVRASVWLLECGIDMGDGADALLVAAGGDQTGITEIAA